MVQHHHMEICETYSSNICQIKFHYKTIGSTLATFCQDLCFQDHYFFDLPLSLQLMANTWNVGLIFRTFPILLSHLSRIALSLIFPTSFPNFCSFPSFFTVSHWETVKNDGFFALPLGNSWVSVLSRPPHPPKS